MPQLQTISTTPHSVPRPIVSLCIAFFLWSLLGASSAHANHRGRLKVSTKANSHIKESERKARQALLAPSHERASVELNKSNAAKRRHKNAVDNIRHLTTSSTNTQKSLRTTAARRLELGQSVEQLKKERGNGFTFRFQQALGLIYETEGLKQRRH
jgi:hypothetical protein